MNRASENASQQQYESGLIDKHYPQDEVEVERKHLAGQYDESEMQGKGLEIKLKGFWNKTIVPAFPEAIGDVSLMKATLHMEDAVKRDLANVKKHPEVGHVAEVRRSNKLCQAEQDFRSTRKEVTRLAFCKYLDIDPNTVHPGDVPIVALGGSGGGYRAMIGVLGYCQEMKTSSLWDLLAYVSGVSGACWSLAAYFTWAEASMALVIEHCKKRLSPFHSLSPEAVREVLHAQGGPARTLGPLVQKHRSGLQTVAMVIYAVFITGHLFLPDPAVDPDKIGREPRKEAAGQHLNWLK